MNEKKRIHNHIYVAWHVHNWDVLLPSLIRSLARSFIHSGQIPRGVEWTCWFIYSPRWSLLAFNCQLSVCAPSLLSTSLSLSSDHFQIFGQCMQFQMKWPNNACHCCSIIAANHSNIGKHLPVCVESFRGSVWPGICESSQPLGFRLKSARKFYSIAFHCAVSRCLLSSNRYGNIFDTLVIALFLLFCFRFFSSLLPLSSNAYLLKISSIKWIDKIRNAHCLFSDYRTIRSCRFS